MREIAYRYSNRRQAADVVDALLQLDGVEVDVYVVPGWVWVRVLPPRGKEDEVRAAMRRYRGVAVGTEAEIISLATEIYRGRQGARFFRGYGFRMRVRKDER